MAGRFLEGLSVGQTFRHDIHRTVTETDNVLFTTMTHNPAAIHLDAEAGKASIYGQVIVNSVFTLGLMVGVSVGDTTLGAAIANLGWDEARFPRPVFVGDALRAETEVISVRPSGSRPNAGVLAFRHVAFNQREEMVARCLRSPLMLRRPSAA